MDDKARMEEFLFDYSIEVMDKGEVSDSYIPAVMELWKESAIIRANQMGTDGLLLGTANIESGG
jgi:hypothetical protein